MSDFDFASARKQTLADIVRDLQERRGEPVSAASTLLRRPPAELAELVAELCGDEYTVNAEGHVQANPDVYGGPMEPAEDDGHDAVGIAEPDDAEPAPSAPAEAAEADPQPAGSTPQAGAGPVPVGSAAPGAGAAGDANTGAAPPPADPTSGEEADDPDLEVITQAISSYLADASEESAIRLRDFVVSQVKGMARPAGGRTSYPDAAIITVLADKNPRRPGTAAHARFAKLASGMTVAEFVAAAGPKGRATLSRAARQMLVKVE